MLKRGDKGPDVVALQDKLIQLGYPLPRWGADGDLGQETIDAFALFMHAHGAEADINPDRFEDEELAMIDRALAAEHVPGSYGFDYVDLRTQSNRKNDHGPRSWKEITAIVLHQTACELAQNPTRMLNVGAHYVVAGLNSGRTVYHLHDEDRVIWHANAFNQRAVGIEVNGLYAGEEGNLATVWDDPSTKKRETPSRWSETTVPVTMDLCRSICERVRAHGGRVKFILPHRQASKDRENDPGSRLWKEVGVELQRELGLSDGGIGFTAGGFPIPEIWDARCKGIHY